MVIKTSPLTAQNLLIKYGRNRSEMYHEVCNTWDMWFTRETMRVYKYKEFHPLEFKAWLKDGQLRFQGIDYNVIYQFCTPEQCKRATKLKLSFRIAHADFNIEPIVLVQIKKESNLT